MHNRIFLLDTGTPRREYSEPIGIEVLTSYIVRSFPELAVDTLSLELDGFFKFEDMLKLNKYIIIGISSKIGSFEIFENVMRSIAKLAPTSVVVCGDILATYAYESLLNSFDKLVCVIGEGENAIAGIVSVVLEHGKNYRKHLAKIKNLAFFDGSSVKITERNEPFDVTKSLHPTRTLLDKIKGKRGIIHLEASRGCVYGDCSFCGIKQKYHIPHWRPLPVEFIIKELIDLSANGIMSPYFTDEDFFGTDIDRVDRIANEIIKLKEKEEIHPDLNFYFNMRVDSVLGVGIGGIQRSSSTLMKLKNAGLREVFIGIESGSNEQMERYNKNNSADKCIRAVMLLNKLGIDVDIGFIMFDPSMSLGTLKNNIDFIYRSGVSMNYSRLAKRLRVEPHTPFSNDYIKKNPNLKLNLSSVSYDYDFENPDIKMIYNIFYVWEQKDLDFIYNLQSFCRGEVPNEEERRKAKNIISLYRSLDVSFLREMCEDAIHNNSSNYISIQDKYFFARENYNEVLEDEIRRITETYRK